MLLKMKAAWCAFPAIFALCLASCSASSELPKTQEVKPAGLSRPILNTMMGELAIASSRLVDNIHDQESRPGERFLLVVLTQPSSGNLAPGEFSLETFQKMVQDSNGQIYVSGKDGVQHISTMAGWVEDEFTMGFTVPIMDSYSLHWPGNSPIKIDPERQ